MGNYQVRKDQNAEFLKAVRTMKKEQNKKSPNSVATNLDKKYRNHLLQELYKVQLPKHYKKPLAEIIQEQITKEDLTSTVALLTILNSNQMTSSILKIKQTQHKQPEISDNVVVKFDEKMLRRRKNKTQMIMSSFSSGHFQGTQQGRVKYTTSMISREVNRVYHPFRLICKYFGELMVEDQCLHNPSSNEDQYEDTQKYMRKVIGEYCKFCVHGCLGLYKKWILQYTGIEQKKYQKWITSIVINEMWVVSENSLRNSVFSIIESIKVPLKINKQSIEKAYVIPEDFSIDAQLQIEGHYFKSIYEVSELTQQWKPTDLIRHLESIKNCICLDVDEYHKMSQKGEVYEINGDNIMGIVAYLLCKVVSKIDEIYTVLMFLKLVYGEIIFYGLDVGSYMYSTITGAIEFLEGKDFNGKKEEDKMDLKDTGCQSVIMQK